MPRSSQPDRLGRKQLTDIGRACLGNVLEWYDWFVYASFSIYFAPYFFPKGNSTAQLLATALVFAAGFLVRPLGGWLLGLYADRHGRRAALSLSVTVMSLGSLAIAVTPGYHAIGLLAPVTLLLARLSQGISAGGEFGSAATYLSEVAAPSKRGFYSSFQYGSITFGQLVALTVMIVLQSILTDTQISQWGWRIPFALGAVGGLTAVRMRRTMTESAHFHLERARLATLGETDRESAGLRALLTTYRRPFVAVLGLSIGGSVAFYTFTTYLQKFLVNTAGIPKSRAAIIVFAALFVFMMLQPVAGAVSDRVGRKPVLYAFSISGMILTVPLLTAIGHTTNPYLSFLLVTIGLASVTCYAALSAIIKAEMFPTRVRALGIGLPQALVAALFGGLSEPIALTLKQAGHESVFFWWVTACIAVTFVTTFFIEEPSRNSPLDMIPETERSGHTDEIDRPGAVR
jgi:MFS transporter, MHS family, alpha-ketoglutarate permease